MIIDPFDQQLDIKPLRWINKWSWRLRIGKWRFKFTLIENDIVIYFWDAGARGNIYKYSKLP